MSTDVAKLGEHLSAERKASAERIENARNALKLAINLLAQERAATGGSRELSTAQTSAETAIMWVKAHGHDGHWRD